MLSEPRQPLIQFMWLRVVVAVGFAAITVAGADRRRPPPSGALLRFMTGGDHRSRGSTAGLSGELHVSPPAVPPPPAGSDESSEPVSVQTPVAAHAADSRAHALDDRTSIRKKCDLRSVDARLTTQAQFREQYQGREPLLLTHAATSWAATSSWAAPSSIAAAHGEIELQLQDPALLATKGTFAPVLYSMPLADYLEENCSTTKLPFFQNRWHRLTDRLLADVNFSDVPTRSVRAHHLFSLGGVGTGVGFHSHAESWLAQVQGRKHWSLARSLGPGWRTKHGCEWMSEDDGHGHSGPSIDYKAEDEPWYMEMMGFRKRPLYQCEVHPGDAIYIPTDLDPLTLSIGGQGDVGDVGGRAALIVAILDNDEPQAKRLLAGLKRDARQRMLQSHLHSGHSAAHMAVMFNRVWALKLLRQQGMDLSVPLRCNADGQSPEMAWRHGTPMDHRGCDLLGTSPWFENINTECNSRGMDCDVVGIPVLYLATRYAALDALKYLTAHANAFSIGGRMRAVLSAAPSTTRVGQKQQPDAAGVEAGWFNIAHVACAYSSVQILEWALNQTRISAAEQGPATAPRVDLLLRDPRGRLPIHYCADLADDPRLLGALLSNTMVDAAHRKAQLMARDEHGRTAEELLSNRLLEPESGRNSRTPGRSRKHQHGDTLDAHMHGRGNGPTRWLYKALHVIQMAKDELKLRRSDGPREASPGDSGGSPPRVLPQHLRGRMEL